MREKRTARGRFFFCAHSWLRLYFALHTKQVDTQRRVEARSRKHAETLDHAEICGRDDVHPHCTHKHHGQCDSGAHTVETAAFALGSCDDDDHQR